ncbi:MAG: hypothetical protein ACFFBC_15030, partial [Promethearchaeota archaeon]
MKSNRKTNIIILIFLGTIFALSPIFVTNLRFTTRDRDITSNYTDEFDYDDIKVSAISGKIHIDGNDGWAAFKAAGNCTGSGNYTHPYVIEDLEIDGGGLGSCVLIENSDVYFIIENCTTINSGSSSNAGIKLSYANNSQLIDNNCSSQLGIGIYLDHSENN